MKEVLGHLIESEGRGFAGRIRTILAGQEPRLEGWDQEAVAAARRDYVQAYVWPHMGNAQQFSAG